MDVDFFGAAGEVTGSCFRIRHGGGSFLVDCGLFQGGRDAARKNLAALDFEVRSLDFVLLTHAHLDHAGLVPRLVALGYKGPIYATQATVDLLAVLLLDAAFIQEKEWEWASRQRNRRQRRLLAPAPLYTVEQARNSLRLLRGCDYGVRFAPAPGVSCLLRDAGHILGSAIAELDVAVQGRCERLVFSGDLGQPGRPVLRDPAIVRQADFLWIESTYGDRRHRSLAETEDELVEAIEDCLVRRAGNVIIPAFAVGRTQEVLWVLADLVRRERLGPMEVFVDSPMAARATELTVAHEALWDRETRELFAWQRSHPDRLRVHFVADVQASKALNARRSGAVIVSASGMCEAGRVRHHLRHNLGRPECTILITGFQAAGTLGRRLVDGARSVTLFGERIPVRARLHTIGGLSAHADREALLAWLACFSPPPRQTFVVHGEARAAQSLAGAIRATLGWPGVQAAQAGEVVRLE